MTIAPEAHVAPTAASSPTAAFDPTLPHRCRDGREVTNLHVFNGMLHGGMAVEHSYQWNMDGSYWRPGCPIMALVNVAPTDSPAPAAGVSEAEVEAAIAKWCELGGFTERVVPALRVPFRAALEAAALARPPAHDIGQGAEPAGYIYEFATLRCSSGAYAGWKKRIGFEAPNVGEAQRNVVPLYAIPQPPVPGGQSDGWRPIKTAPEDCDIVMGWGSYPREDREPSPAFMRRGTVDGWCVNGYEFTPTHWRPLPAPPGTAPTPAPSNAGEEEAVFVERMAEECITLDHDTLELERLFALARRGLNAPTRPAEAGHKVKFVGLGEVHGCLYICSCGETLWGDAAKDQHIAETARPAEDEVTEAVAAEREACAQVADGLSETEEGFSDTRLFNAGMRHCAKRIAAALRARTGR